MCNFLKRKEMSEKEFNERFEYALKEKFNMDSSEILSMFADLIVFKKQTNCKHHIAYRTFYSIQKYPGLSSKREYFEICTNCNKKINEFKNHEELAKRKIKITKKINKNKILLMEKEIKDIEMEQKEK